MHDALGATLRAHTMRSEPFAREAAAWVLFSEAAARERALAASEYASIAHLLLAWHVLWGPFRGGDSGLIYVVTPSDPRATDRAGPNVLVLDPSGSVTVIIRHHKTARALGPIQRGLPPALQDIVRHSLAAQPRETLFVRPSTGAAFRSEESYNT